MFVVEVIIVGGGLTDFLRASCSSCVFSAPVVSVSMSVVMRGVRSCELALISEAA
jgi:hypothetical protein